VLVFIKKRGKNMSRISSVGEQSEIILYIWDRCPHSQKLLQDLSQLSEQIQERVDIVDIADAIRNNSYPPPMTCTPCLYVTNMSTNGSRPMPLVLNGRKQILVFCGLQAADVVGKTMTDDDAMGASRIGNIFEKTAVQESGDKRDVSKLVNHGNFEFVIDEASAAAAATKSGGRRMNLFENTLDDPTVAQDPRVSRKVADALSELQKSRNYA
jgi:hypothetical protein